MRKHRWYAWLTFGSDPAPARGPHPSMTDSLDALERFRAKHGANAGSFEAVGSLRLVEFLTRANARQSNISNYSELGGKTVAH